MQDSNNIAFVGLKVRDELRTVSDLETAPVLFSSRSRLQHGVVRCAQVRDGTLTGLRTRVIAGINTASHHRIVTEQRYKATD